MKMSQRGQMNTGMVWSIIIMLVSISIGGLVFGRIITTTETEAEGSGEEKAYATLNSAITDNGGGTSPIPTHWENAYFTGDNRRGYIDNVGVLGGGGTVGDNHYLQDNDNGTFWWYQTLEIPYSNDISSASVSFKYQISDNSGLGGSGAWHFLKVILGTSTENYTIWDNRYNGDGHIAADNNTWHTQENDITDFISAGATTYTLYLYDNCRTVSTSANTDNVVVRWDDITLTVTTYDMGIAENIVGDVGGAGTSLFPLIILMVTISVFVAIISVLKYLG